MPVLSCEVDHTSEHVTLRLAHRLLAGTTAVLQLSYTGPICTTDGRGFYACTHADPSEDDRQVWTPRAGFSGCRLGLVRVEALQRWRSLGMVDYD